MQKILCYGDSNTFGYNPKNGSRFKRDSRWSGILKINLANEYEVIEEGINNRTGVADNPDGFNRSGMRHFPKLLEKLQDVRFLVLAVGTNDLQSLFNIDFTTLENGILKLINLATAQNIKTILVPPVKLDTKVLLGAFSFQFDETSVLKSQQASTIYKRIAETTQSYYFDFNTFVKPSDLDGLHYDEISHRLIAENLTKYIREIVS